MAAPARYVKDGAAAGQIRRPCEELSLSAPGSAILIEVNLIEFCTPCLSAEADQAPMHEHAGEEASSCYERREQKMVAHAPAIERGENAVSASNATTAPHTPAIKEPPVGMGAYFSALSTARRSRRFWDIGEWSMQKGNSESCLGLPPHLLRDLFRDNAFREGSNRLAAPSRSR